MDRCAVSLYGRNDDLRSICSFFSEAAVKGGSLMIAGESGIGKSALLETVARRADDDKAITVLRVGGAQFEADIAYSGLNQLLFPLLAHTDDLDPVHRDALRVATGIGSGPAPDRLVVSTATLFLLRRVARSGPVMLVADDVTWLDRSTAIVLGFVARRLIGTPIGFLASVRSDADGYFERGGLPERVLRPLDDQGAHELLRAVHPQLAYGVRRRIVAEALGNPLALVELPRLLTGAQQHAESSMPSVLPLNERLKALFAKRVADLSPDCREALLLAALDGSGDLSVIENAVGLSLTDALGPAERAGVVTVDLAAYRLHFCHPLLASAVVEAATSGERRAAHHRLADILTDRPERRAWHLGEAASSADEDVAKQLEAAAQRSLARGDATGAVAALSHSARLSPSPQDRSRRLAEAAYIGADAGGEMRGASVLLDSARRADPALLDGPADSAPEPRSALLAAAATAYVLINTDGDVDTAHALLADAVDTYLTIGEKSGGPGSAPGRADDFALAEAMHTLMLLCWYGGRAELWHRLLAALDRWADGVPDLLWVMSRTWGDPARTGGRALDRLDRVLADAREETDPSRVVRMGIASLYADRSGELREAFWRVVREGRGGRHPARRHLGALLNLVIEDMATGRWDEAGDLADEALQVSDEYEYDLFTWYFRYSRAFVAAVRGWDRTNRQLTEQIVQWAGPRGAGGVALCAAYARALSALGSGDFEEAYRQSCLLSPAGELAPFVPLAMWGALDLVEAAVRTGREAEARAHARAVRESDMPALSPRMRMHAHAVQALAAGAGRDAATHFEQALSDDRARRWPFEYARVELLYGEYLRRARKAGEARLRLAAALSAFQGLGAVPWAERAAAELRAAGETRTADPVDGAPRTKALLTHQEKEIAALAAGGLTNKQIGERLFLSHRTIGTHLYQIYPKLGITSRAALRDALAALDEQG
ncbi:AAA family ATPase [Streptomyces sp. J2-1]|nr:AAA family ATPase [Streptomyces corallincola]